MKKAAFLNRTTPKKNPRVRTSCEAETDRGAASKLDRAYCVPIIRTIRRIVKGARAVSGRRSGPSGISDN